ncbi:MAG: hydantoinase B/oxoprolinase family protein [Vicinamibacterales bacterium]|jgi:N-methylhydantoinase B|nr:hydantoin utilization protein B [Acidobacteriota bacterium]MDP6371185.1 hydantoinase B/oxoprolinase family protein [Vicinamibacterales bacterium]MDP6608266.1 hydantoinase B/oxoprolinase family protein [Vicinamibacterales bacterium]HAK54181.1 hydantoin utilization protein B [Acidobacteriota bacterium]|tara:strand:+ start:28436 stop:30211 length:1776 start_codon:yes stop_codon:yes gene_type:complete
MSRSTPIDRVLVAIIGRALKAITDEMSVAMEKTTRSPILCEAKDFVTGLYDAEGRMLEQTENLPILSFSLGPVCRHIAEQFRGQVYPGDVFFHNDVFSFGNQNNDVAAFMPIFVGDTLVAWAACKGHQADIGGAVRGGYNPNATEVWQEALRIPAVKVHERGELRRDVWDLIFANVRLPIVEEDMRAEIGSCAVGERRLRALVEKYGLERFTAHKAALFESTRRMMESEIRSIPNGTYSGEATVYFDGRTPGSRYRIRVAITVEDERVVFDYSETDPQTDGFVNGTYTSSASATILTFLQMVDARIPHNQGIIEPIEIIIPEGTILNAAYPAATTFGNHLCPPNADAIIRALAPVIPDRVTAGWNNLLCSLSTGHDPRRRDTYVDILFMGLKGGSGATSDCDGYDHIGMIDASGGLLDQDYEMFEQQTPHLLERHEFLTDSAGAGRFRGGLGVETRYRVGGEKTQLVVFGDGDAEPAFGLFGGQDGTLNSIALHLPDGTVRKTASKEIVAAVPAGTGYVQQAGGGGGFGPPHERPAETVRREVADELISIDAAGSAYGVVIDSESGQVLEAETAARRAAMAAAASRRATED